MERENLNKLMEVLHEEDALRLKVLNNAAVDALENYQKTPTAANLKNWKSADSALDELAGELWSRYFPEESTLGNIIEVVEYLQGKGWKISQSTGYNHRNKGKLRPDSSGRFPVSAVEEYARNNLDPLDGLFVDKTDGLQIEKARAEIKKLTAQAKHWDTKARIQDGEYIEKKRWDHELAARARVFKSDMENFIRSRASEIIRTVEGNPEKTPELIDFYLDHLEMWLDRYSKPKTWTVRTETINPED
jgi:hypothetical protein